MTSKHAVFPRLRASANLALMILAGTLPDVSVAGAQGAASATIPVYATNRIILQPRAGLSDANLAKILKIHNGVARRIGKSDMHIVTLPNGSASAVAKILARHAHLKFVEQDRLVKNTSLPNDPYLGSQWHMTKIGAPAAWDTAPGMGSTIKIAILDSGVDPTHPDLAGNLIPGYNFIDNNTNTADACGHGTAVAGVAAAVSNNSIGVAGIAGNAKIMPVRIAYYDTAQSSCYAYYSTIISGINFAADNGARIVNVSYAGVSGSAGIQNAAQYLKSKGGLLFVAAGNTGTDTGAAATSNMVVVSATDQNDNITSWSSYGADVTISAPGAGIYTTTQGGGYGQWNGTSFSSPLTAGVGALVMSANTQLSNASVEKLLYSSALDLGATGRDNYYGNGRVNAAAAVQGALNLIIKTDTQAPTSAITAPRASDTVSGLVPVDVAVSDNVGVIRAELAVNGKQVAVDTSAPFGFTWDSAGVPNGMANLVVTAFDAAGNSTASAPVTVNVANAVAAPVLTWTKCATEGTTCQFSGTHQVRYGANNSYAYQTATGSIACTNAVFGDPMVGIAKTCEYANDTVTVAPTPTPAPAPVVDNWIRCANEWGTCNFSGTAKVRYGANNTYAYQIATGSISCTNAVFGDPLSGIVKACDYLVSTSAPAPTPVVETWTDCASEGAYCTFTGTREVRYGANGTFAKQIINASTACTNAVFGDPAYGIVKNCSYSSITR